MKHLSRILALSLSLLLATPTWATDFLYDPGTSNNGLIVGQLTVVDGTTTNALAAAAVVASTTVCTSGVCSNSDTAQGIWGIAQLASGTFQGACTAGANVAGWFQETVDGTNYPTTSAVPARAPDFIIPLPTGTTAGYFNSQIIRLPALKFKTVIQNNCTVSGGGGTFSANTSNVVTLGILAVKY